ARCSERAVMPHTPSQPVPPSRRRLASNATRASPTSNRKAFLLLRFARSTQPHLSGAGATLQRLMLSTRRHAVGQQRYYEQQVALGGDDYYSGRGEAPGEWIGAGARALGLEGRVSGEAFSALVAGHDPRQPATRLRDGQQPKVAALDFTFSAPKSVSVLFAVAG